MKNAILHLHFLFLLMVARGAVIDFEQVLMSIPTEGMAISNQFEKYYGIRFRRSGGDLPWPVIAKTGWPQSAFERGGSFASDTANDTAAHLVGDCFLTDTAGGDGGRAGVYIILECVKPLSRVNGRIIDIDGDESIQVRAYSDTDGANLLTNLTFDANSPDTGDGVATSWEITSESASIQRIELRSGGGNVGYDLIDSDFAPHYGDPPVLANPAPYAGFRIHGEVGMRYKVELAHGIEKHGDGTLHTNWIVLTTNLFLPSTNYLYVDTQAPIQPQRFYRVGSP